MGIPPQGRPLRILRSRKAQGWREGTPLPFRTLHNIPSERFQICLSTLCSQRKVPGYRQFKQLQAPWTEAKIKPGLYLPAHLEKTFPTVLDPSFRLALKSASGGGSGVATFLGT